MRASRGRFFPHAAYFEVSYSPAAQAYCRAAFISSAMRQTAEPPACLYCPAPCMGETATPVAPASAQPDDFCTQFPELRRNITSLYSHARQAMPLLPPRAGASRARDAEPA